MLAKQFPRDVRVTFYSYEVVKRAENRKTPAKDAEQPPVEEEEVAQ